MAIGRDLRKRKIEAFLRSNEHASVEELGSQLGKSRATIRRYLEELAVEGRIQRVRGGAVLPDSLKSEPPIVLRGMAQSQEKHRIAGRAADLVQDGETVFIGTGSTALEVARHLKSKSELTVITNSLPVINLLADSESFRIIVAGGMFRSSERSLIGHLLEVCLAELRADKAIIGIQGIDPVHGLTNEYLPETVSDRVILKFASRVILVADHTKFGRIKSSFVAGVAAIDTLVTDGLTDVSFLTTLRQMGIQVLVAE